LCPVVGNGVQIIQYPGNSQSIITLPSGAKPDSSVVQVAPDPNTAFWATDLHYGSGTPNLDILQLQPRGAVLNSFTVPGYLSSGALTTQNAIWAVGNGITYVHVCPGQAGQATTYTPYTVPYGDEPMTKPGGIVGSPVDLSAWFIDNSSQTIVNVQPPASYCPRTDVSAVKSVIKVRSLSVHHHAGRLTIVPPGIGSATLVPPGYTMR
jgi:hypothetical protein